MMKIRHLVWSEIDKGGYSELHSTIFDGGSWVTVIIFEEDGCYHAHTDNRDPSEHLYSADTLEEVKNAVQVLHNESMREWHYKELPCTIK